MKAIKKCLFLFMLLPVFSGNTHAQQQYTLRDQAEITYRAQLILTNYKDLLNVISFSGINQAEIQELIENSYTNSPTQIFYSQDAIIEDNINPANLKDAYEQDKPVKEYLNNFDLTYAKSDEETVEFSDFQTSALKYRNYLYIKVKYTCLLKGRHTKDTTAYKSVDRLAEVRVEKQGNEWKTFIASIIYYKPENPIEGTEDDVVLDKSVEDDGTFSGLLSKLSRSYNSVKELQNVEALSAITNRQDSIFNHYMALGQQAMDAGNVEEAFEAYSSAGQIHPYNAEFRRKFLAVNAAFTKRNSNKEDAFKKAFDEAERAKAVRNYTKAKNLYLQAYKLKPDETSVLERSRALDVIIANQAVLESKYNTGAYKEAIKDYSKALKNQSNADYYFGRGRCYEALTELKDAIKDYSKAIELDGNFMEARNSRARLSLKLGQPHDAIADYSVIITNPDYSAEFLPIRAQLRDSIQDHKGAIEDYAAAISLTPEVAENYFKKGLIHYNQNQYDEAFADFSEAVKRNTAYTDAYYYRGCLQTNRKEIKQAASDFARARQLGVSDTQERHIQSLAFSYFSVGNQEMNLLQYDEAISSFINAIMLYPAYASAWLRKGDAYFNMEDYESAITNYTKSLEFDSLSFVYFQRAVAYEHLKEHEQALKDFSSYLPIGNTVIARSEANFKSLKANQSSASIRGLMAGASKDFARSLYALGYAQLMTGDYPGAINNLDKALEVEKAYAEAYFARGSAQFASNEPKKAIKDFNQSITLGFDKPVVFYALGKAYKAKGKTAEAIGSFSKAIELNQNYEEALRERFLSLKENKQYLLALQDVKTIFKLNETAQQEVALVADKGILELYQQDVEAAGKSFDQALDLNGEDGWALYGKACMLASQNQIEASLPFYQKAFQTKQIEWAVIKKDPLLKPVSKNKAFKEMVKTSF